MDPDQPNAETRAAKARLAVSEIMRVPLQVATGPTCTPQGCECIQVLCLHQKKISVEDWVFPVQF